MIYQQPPSSFLCLPKKYNKNNFWSVKLDMAISTHKQEKTIRVNWGYVLSLKGQAGKKKDKQEERRKLSKVFIKQKKKPGLLNNFLK